MGIRRIAMLLASMALAVLLASGVVLAQRTTPHPTLEQNPAGKIIPGRYIVVLEEGDAEEGRDPTTVAQVHARRHGTEVLHTYEHALRGYAARIPDRRLEEVRADSSVAHVEPDRQVHAEAQRLPWGIDKIDADASSTEAGNGSGAVSNVRAYVVDSGIYKHPDLNVVKHINFAGDGKNRDCNGHGTHVAGTVAAKDNARDVVGVAPGAPLIGVKVLGCRGGGALSGVIKGVDWVTAHADKPAIANMSLGLGGEPSLALDEALRKSARRGILYSVPAGNKGTGTCSGSPARTGAGTNNGIVTTAMTNESDEEAPLSNYGPCVDIWAPGVLVLSTEVGGGTTTMGGTSMAAPHVGGGAALYLSSHPGAGSSAVEGALKDAAMKPGTKSKDGRAVLLENVGGF